jgi:hypothetical protein
MDIAIANAAAMGLPWLLVATWVIVAVIAYAATREFLERLRE